LEATQAARRLLWIDGRKSLSENKKLKKKSYAYFSSAWLLGLPLAAAVLFFYGDLPKPSFLVFLGVRCAGRGLPVAKACDHRYD
jgi:hypothetical protein